MTHRTLIACLVTALLASHALAEAPPALGIAAPIRVIGTVDGDTIDVEIVTRVRVRLIDCWAAELNTQEGKSAKLYMDKYALGRHGVLFVPRGKKQLGDSTNLSRALGYVWVDGLEQSVNATLVETGYATRTKIEKEKRWPNLVKTPPQTARPNRNRTLPTRLHCKRQSTPRKYLATNGSRP